LSGDHRLGLDGLLGSPLWVPDRLWVTTEMFVEIRRRKVVGVVARVLRLWSLDAPLSSRGVGANLERQGNVEM